MRFCAALDPPEHENGLSATATGAATTMHANVTSKARASSTAPSGQGDFQAARQSGVGRFVTQSGYSADPNVAAAVNKLDAAFSGSAFQSASDASRLHNASHITSTEIGSRTALAQCTQHPSDFSARAINSSAAVCTKPSVALTSDGSAAGSINSPRAYGSSEVTSAKEERKRVMVAFAQRLHAAVQELRQEILARFTASLGFKVQSKGHTRRHQAPQQARELSIASQLGVLLLSALTNGLHSFGNIVRHFSSLSRQLQDI